MRSVFEEIKERLPINDVLSSYITLTPAGTQFKAKCPFHNERTASFYVTPERGLYYCFGCAAKGDIFTFVQEFEGVDASGALKILAARAGIELTKDSFARDSLSPVFDALEETCSLYEKELEKNTSALNYLEKRGVKKETIKKFRIGYAPEGWDFITRHFAGAKQSLAEKAGLLKKGERGNYDRFRSRIMFPINDASGRVVGFSGRIFPDIDDGPKYLNSPETELFQKSKLLFGYDKAKLDIKRRNFTILVEGQFDLIMSHQAGFTNTVATSGTALSEDVLDGGISNLATIARLSPNIILAYDGDEAGKKALDRASRIALQLGLNPKAALLPEKVDPADYIKEHGVDGWKKVLQESQHVVLFQLHDLATKNLSPHHFATALRTRVFPYLALIPSQIELSRQLELISQASAIPINALLQDFESYLKTREKTAVLEKNNDSTKATKKQFSVPALFLGILSWQSGLAEAFIDTVLYREKADAIVFKEFSFRLPELDESELHASRIYCAATYGGLEKQALVNVVDDLLDSLTITFLNGLRSKFTAELAFAEQKKDEEKTELLLGLLHDITVRLQALKK